MSDERIASEAVMVSPLAEVLRPWREFPVAQSPRPIVFLDSPVHLGAGGFLDGDAKRSWAAAAIESAVPLPAGILDLITHGQIRRESTTLTISDVQRCDEEFWCDRGPRRLPAYRLVISGLRQPCLVLDPSVDRWWPEHNVGRDRRGADRALIRDDDVTLDFPAFGGILTEFLHARFDEFATCVVGHAVTRQRPVPPGTAVRAVGVRAMVTGHLNAPLGGRVLLHATGEPVAVVAAQP